LESALRECLRHRVAAARPPAEWAAETAIRRARAVRRRQVGTGAVAAVTVAVAVGLALPRSGPVAPSPDQPVIALSATPTDRRPSPSPVPTREPSPLPAAALPGDVRQELLSNRSLPVDVVVADRLLTSSGDWVDLTGVGRVAEAYEVADGWLVLSARGESGASLWYVAEDAEPRRLLAAAAVIIVAAAGDRVAWRDREQVYVGTLVRNRLLTDAGTRAPAGAVPVGFVGDGLLLGRREAEALDGSYTVWWPSRGALTTRWRTATGVYGALPDGRTVVAQVAGGARDQPCLALLDARADLAVRRQACDVPLTAGALGWVSPDGRWLVAEHTAAESVLIDVDGVFEGGKPAVGAGPRPNGPGAWTDGGTLVYGGTGYLARLRLDRAAQGHPDAVERIAVRGGDDRPVLAVPRLS
jgi:hypothetical protein